MTTLSSLTDEALEAFWRIVADQFPEATTGDLSPGTAIALSIAAEAAIDEWIAANVNTQDCDIAVGYCFRLFRLEGQDSESSTPSGLTGVVTAVDEHGVWGRMDQPVTGAPCDNRIHWKTRYEFSRSTVPA